MQEFLDFFGLNAASASQIGVGCLETLYMTVVSTLLSYIIGIPLGIALVLTGRKGLRPMKKLYRTLDLITNIARSVPFLILLILVIPITTFIVGKSYGSTATIVPLVLSAAPFVARMVESSLSEVSHGVIEAAQSMGASLSQIVFKVMLPEARTSLLIGATISSCTILGYSAMAGVVAGGGLGAIAINYGYYRYQFGIMAITVVLLVGIVQIMQYVGMYIAHKLDHRVTESK